MRNAELRRGMCVAAANALPRIVVAGYQPAETAPPPALRRAEKRRSADLRSASVNCRLCDNVTEVTAFCVRKTFLNLCTQTEKSCHFCHTTPTNPHHVWVFGVTKRSAFCHTLSHLSHFFPFRLHGGAAVLFSLPGAPVFKTTTKLHQTPVKPIADRRYGRGHTLPAAMGVPRALTTVACRLSTVAGHWSALRCRIKCSRSEIGTTVSFAVHHAPSRPVFLRRCALSTAYCPL